MTVDLPKIVEAKYQYELKQQDARITELETENARLRDALLEIASQKLIAECEIDDDGNPSGDFEYAYDEIVKRARNAMGE